MKTNITNRVKLESKMFIIVCLFITAMLIQDHTFATTSSTTMEVSAIVKSNCKVQGSSISFGSYDPADANSKQPLMASGNINLNCTRGSTVKVNIDSGTHANQAGNTTRAMASNDTNEYLAYELYTDSGRSHVWDRQTNKEYYAESAAISSLNVYAKIPENQKVSDGNYSDTLTIMITY